MKTAVIYARYSSDKQTEQSIEGQLRECNEYADRHDIKIVDTYIDRAMTGTNDNRAAFQQMMKDSNKKAWDLVLVYKLDRFSRDKYEMAIHRHTLKENGIKIVSAKEAIPDGPEGIILEALLEGMNQYYSAELSQKVTRGMRETRLKGNFSGGTVLFGYRVENKKVVVHDDEAEIVRQIFNEVASGKQVIDILAELNEKGVLNKGKKFARNTLYRMLTNEKYIGKFIHGDEVLTNIYPAIVPTDVFEIVRTKMEHNKYGKHKPEIYYLLRNKIICGYCGSPISSDSGTSKSGKVMRYYKCYGKRIQKKDCELTPVRKEILEKFVVDATYEALAEVTDIEHLAEQIIEREKKLIDDQSILNILQQEFTEVQKGIDNLLNAMEKGIITDSTKERLEKLETRKNELATNIAIEKSKNKLSISKDEVISFVETSLKKNPKVMIDRFVKQVVLYNDKIEIFYNYSDRRTDKNTPDGNCQGLCFYKTQKSFYIDYHRYDEIGFNLKFDILLYI
jgi:DNA invertase Pin-like site-specific DNA recombinase